MQLQQQLVSLRADQEACRAHCEASQLRYNQLQGEIDTLSTEQQSLSQQKSDLDSQFISLRDSMNAANINQMLADLQSLGTQVATISARLQEIDSLLDTQSREMADVARSQIAKQAELESFGPKITRVVDLLQAFQDNVGAIVKDYADVSAGL